MRFSLAEEGCFPTDLTNNCKNKTQLPSRRCWRSYCTDNNFRLGWKPSPTKGNGFAKGKNWTHCQIHLSCEINQIAVCAAFCLNMLFSSNPNPTLSDSVSCRNKAMVRKKFLWFFAPFSCCTFANLEFDCDFLYEAGRFFSAPSCRTSFFLMLIAGSSGMLGAWLMFLIVPLCFLNKVHVTKCKVARKSLHFQHIIP